MSIASEIQRLSGVRSDIFTSITNKGVTVPEGSTFSSCPSLIDQIEGGGGGPATSMINPTFTASGYASGYRPFTATQNQVPLYDNYTGNYTTSFTNNLMLIQIPMSIFNGTDSLYNYEFRHSWKAYSIDTQSINIIPNSANLYGNIYTTNIRTTDDYTQIAGSPYTYYKDYTQSDFISWWNNIQAQSWIATAYTGEYVYLGCQQYSNPTNIEGIYSYLVQTGTDVPYPTYSTTTTGYITNEISGKESFTGSTTKVPNIYVSGFKNVVYEDSPEGGVTTISPVIYDLNSFSTNMLKNNITAKSNYSLNSTAYTYNYGAAQTAYSGFEGI